MVAGPRGVLFQLQGHEGDGSTGLEVTCRGFESFQGEWQLAASVTGANHEQRGRHMKDTMICVDGEGRLAKSMHTADLIPSEIQAPALAAAASATDMTANVQQWLLPALLAHPCQYPVSEALWQQHLAAHPLRPILCEH